MSSSSGIAERTAVRTRREPAPQQRQPAGGWFAQLGGKGQRAFRAAFAGYMLDAFDLIVLTLSLSAIGATFNVGTGARAALSTGSLAGSAIGGVLGGVLADRIGRARTLMLSVAVYSLFTFLSGLASSYAMLMTFRVFEGIGFGAEWGVGAVLVAALVRPPSRVEDAEVYRKARHDGVPLKEILSGRLLKTTIAASILATGIQGGYYAMFTWIPTYLKKERDLTVVGTSGYLFVVIAGAFLGYLA